MPIYEYYCGHCNKTYEIIQPVNAPRTLECGLCDGIANRIMSSFRTKVTGPEDNDFKGKDPKIMAKMSDLAASLTMDISEENKT